MSLRSALNFGVRWLVRVLLLLLIALQLAYLLRRPLFERWLCRELSRVAGGALGGEVEIAGLGGDWVTTVIAHGVNVRSDGVLQKLEDAELSVQVDVWRLIHSDLSGLLRARVRARVAALQLTSDAPSAAPSETPIAWPALGGFAHLLPQGAEVVLDQLSLQAATTIAGPVRGQLARERAGRARWFTCTGLGAQVDVELPREGDVEVSVRARDAARWALLFAPEVAIAGGDAHVHARGRLDPTPTAAARARLTALDVVGLHVEHVTAAGLVTLDGVRGGEAEFTVNGTPGQLHAVDFAFRELPWPRTAHASLAVHDATPWLAFVPPELRTRLPSPRTLRARGTFARQRLDVDVDAAVNAQAYGLGDQTSVKLHAHAGSEGAAVGTLRLTAAGADLVARGSLRDTTLRSLFATPSAVLRTPLAGEIDLHADELQRIDLSLFGLQARGRLAIAGTVAGSLVAPRPDLQIDSDDLDVGPTDGPPWVTAATTRVHLAHDALRIDSATAQVAGEQLSLSGAATVRDDRLTLTDVGVFDGRGGRVQLAGSVAFDSADWRAALRTGADLRLNLTDVDPSPWLGFGLGPGLDAEQIAGLRLTGEVTWRTRGNVDLRASLLARATHAGLVQRPFVTLTLHGDEQATVLDHLQAGADDLVAEATAHIACSPRAILDDLDAFLRAPARADLQLPTLSLDALPASPRRPLPFNELSGQVSGQARLRGTLAAPSLAAGLQVVGGRLRTTTGERLDDITAAIALTTRTAHIVGTASRGKGPLTLQGSVSARAPLWLAGAATDVALTLQGTNVLLHRQAGVRVRADLDVNVRGPLDNLVVGGSVALRDSRIVTRVPLIDLRRTGGVAISTGIQLPGFALPAPMRARLDLDITTKEPIAAKTNVFEGDLYAQLDLLGPTTAPRLQGTITGPDATVILPGVRLRASALLLQFTNENPTLPTLTLTAAGRRHGYNIQVTARGRYDRPDVEFSSDPPLPPDDLVVLVTTGARPSGLRSTTGVGAVLGAYAAQELADWMFGSDSTEAKERFLDRFTIQTGAEMSSGGSESIVVEFKLGDRLFLQGERDVYEDINMGVVYRIRFR